MLFSLAFCTSVTPISKYASCTFAAFSAVHFYYNLIFLTIEDIPSHLNACCLVILLISLQTKYRGRAGRCTCLLLLQITQAKYIVIQERDRDQTYAWKWGQLSFVTHQVKEELWNLMLSLKVKYVEIPDYFLPRKQAGPFFSSPPPPISTKYWYLFSEGMMLAKSA